MGRSTGHGVNSAWTARLAALKGRTAAPTPTCGAAPQSPINASVSPALMTLRQAAHTKSYRTSCTATRPAKLHDRTANHRNQGPLDSLW